MKWLFSAHKATKCFLHSRRYHLYNGFCPRKFLAFNLVKWSKSKQMQFIPLYSGHYYSTTTINSTESSHGLVNSETIENDHKKVDVEIFSRETIKPPSPTPNHLRTFNLSIIDQNMYDVYIPFILFFPNINKASVAADVAMKRSKHLKESLAEILPRFYPLAGKVMDNFHIECNDEGIYYTEARVNHTLTDFLGDPDDETVRGLMLQSCCIGQSSIGNYVIGIQVNIFKCGGIGLSVSVSHKIVDGQTFYIFMKAWTAAARRSSITISPSFVASQIFPNNPSLEYSAPSKLLATKMLCTKRIVFDSTALALLKAQPVTSASSSQPPTRTVATTAVVWKAVANAASKVRPFGPKSPHVIFPVVNLRKRASPPIPKESIGNIINAAAAFCFPASHLDLPTMMGELRESIAKMDSNYIETMKGEKGHETYNEIQKKTKPSD
ncbi:hypothetical protein QVD17_16612 [Tagetes erecta]|uniref:Transferase, Chloramphenicol acetyltransferase-like domain protein n=1 Tax=Tagetes erecta TaxID=13708 RepID=A0AAD8P0S6_TARER|nr:hypothetical protein QVD17_16612 [Tagetes erecta]